MTKCPLPKGFSGTQRVSGFFTGLLVLLLGAWSVAGAAPLAYVSNNADGTVSVIDVAPPSGCPIAGQSPPCVVATLKVGTSPSGVAVNPAGTFAYVANWGDDSVSVIRTSTPPTPPPRGAAISTSAFSIASNPGVSSFTSPAAASSGAT